LGDDTANKLLPGPCGLKSQFESSYYIVVDRNDHISMDVSFKERGFAHFKGYYICVVKDEVVPVHAMKAYGRGDVAPL
jgi:hypothetical protein